MQVIEANVVRGKDYGFVHLSAGLDLAWLDQVLRGILLVSRSVISRPAGFSKGCSSNTAIVEG